MITRSITRSHAQYAVGPHIHHTPVLPHPRIRQRSLVRRGSSPTPLAPPSAPRPAPPTPCPIPLSSLAAAEDPGEALVLLLLLPSGSLRLHRCQHGFRLRLR